MASAMAPLVSANAALLAAVLAVAGGFLGGPGGGGGLLVVEAASMIRREAPRAALQKEEEEDGEETLSQTDAGAELNNPPMALAHSTDLSSPESPEDAGAMLEAGNQLVFVQVADPQLGMQNVGNPDPKKRKDMTAEVGMLDTALELVKSLQPAFVVFAGDLQDAWPIKEHGGLPGAAPWPRAEQEQQAAFKNSLRKLGSIPYLLTPGNHDIDDTPTKQTISQFERAYFGNTNCRHPRLAGMVWNETNLGSGKSTCLCGYFTNDKAPGYHFMYLDSQVFQDPGIHAFKPKGSHSPFLNRERNSQKNRLQGFMKKVKDLQKKQGHKKATVVLFTHIPPFMDSISEKHGWGNWDAAWRKNILKALTKHKIAGLEIIFVCGHFHHNVDTQTKFSNVPVRVIVSDSIGVTMHWKALDGKTGAALSKAASSVASQAIGGAFFNNIMKKTDGDEGGFEVDTKRLKVGAADSGIRIFKVNAQGVLKTSFFTVQRLGSVAQWVRSG